MMLARRAVVPEGDTSDDTGEESASVSGSDAPTMAEALSERGMMSDPDVSGADATEEQE